MCSSATPPSRNTSPDSFSGIIIMLSVDTGDGFVTVNEGDTIVLEDDGTLRIEQ